MFVSVTNMNDLQKVKEWFNNKFIKLFVICFFILDTFKSNLIGCPMTKLICDSVVHC